MAHDVILICGTFRQPLIPGLDIRQGRAVDLDVEIAVGHTPQRNIRHGKAVAADIGLIRKVLIQNSQGVMRFVAQLGDLFGVTLVRVVRTVAKNR